MHTPWPPIVDCTDAPADLNGLIRFAERRNLVSARVPSHYNWHLLVVACPRPSISVVGNPVPWVASRKILIHIKQQEYSILDGQWGKTCSAFAHIHCRMWCDTSLFYQRYWHPFLFLSWRYSRCLSFCVIYLLPFCLFFENVMIMICNMQCYILTICAWKLASHIKEII